MKGSKSDSLDWALWFYWIMATTLGWLLGNLLFSGIPFIISGAAIAAFQWAVLIQRIHKAWRWAVYSTLGWIIGYIVFVIAVPPNMEFFLGPIIGLTVGIAQWLLLKNIVYWAGWWMVISIIAWTTGLVIVPGLLSSGALPGALTGLTLVVTFRFSPAKDKNGLTSNQ